MSRIISAGVHELDFQRGCSWVDLSGRPGGEVTTPLLVLDDVIQNVDEMPEGEGVNFDFFGNFEFAEQLPPVVIAERHVTLAVFEGGDRFL